MFCCFGIKQQPIAGLKEKVRKMRTLNPPTNNRTISANLEILKRKQKQGWFTKWFYTIAHSTSWANSLSSVS